MVTKTLIAQEFFFITAAHEFKKIDELVARQGDGCLVLALKTIQKARKSTQKRYVQQQN
jgi:hypothetical protein